MHTHNLHIVTVHSHKLLGLDGSEYSQQCIISNKLTILKWYYLIDYGIQPSATGDMIVAQGTSILIYSFYY